ncbi:MAG: hypothetical protein QOJ08_1398, partial [Ilumatobacteraceae bacterium]
MSQPASWFPDPYGRFEQRYFDGDNWTAYVISNGEQSVDPLGVTVSVPFATPRGDTTAEATPAGSAVREFLDGLGPDARTRPPVHLSIALAGVGGAAAAAGIATAIIGDGDSNKGRNIAAAAVVVAIAYAVRVFVASQPEVRSAAVGAAAIGIPAVPAAITDTDPGGGTLILAAVLLLLAWALPIMRGRPLLLGLGAISVVLALATTSDNSAASSDVFDTGFADVVGGNTWLFVL